MTVQLAKSSSQTLQRVVNQFLGVAGSGVESKRYLSSGKAFEVVQPQHLSIFCGDASQRFRKQELHVKSRHRHDENRVGMMKRDGAFVVTRVASPNLPARVTCRADEPRADVVDYFGRLQKTRHRFLYRRLGVCVRQVELHDANPLQQWVQMVVDVCDLICRSLRTSRGGS